MPSPDTVRVLSQVDYPLFISLPTCARALAAVAQYRAIREAPGR